MSKGKLEKTGANSNSVSRSYPGSARLADRPFVARQRESDALLEKLRDYEGRRLPDKERKERINLRDDLRVLTDAEDEAARAIMLMLADTDVSVWVLKVWEKDAPPAIEAFVNNQLRPRKSSSNASTLYLRMSPPGDPERRCSEHLSQDDISAISTIKEWRREKFGKPLTETVDELPPDVRARVAIPRIVQGSIQIPAERSSHLGSGAQDERTQYRPMDDFHRLKDILQYRIALCMRVRTKGGLRPTLESDSFSQSSWSHTAERVPWRAAASIIASPCRGPGREAAPPSGVAPPSPGRCAHRRDAAYFYAARPPPRRCAAAS